MLRDEFKKIVENLGEATSEVKTILEADYAIVSKEAKKALKIADRNARKVALHSTKIYRDYKVGDRATGATVGAKFGVIAGIPAGPIGMKTLGVTFAVVGGILGPNAIKRVEKWRDGSSEKKDDDPENHNDENTPSALS